VDVYKSRHRQPSGTVRKQVSICLTPNEWAVLEEDAARYEDSIAYTVSTILGVIASNAQEGRSLRSLVARALAYYDVAQEGLPEAEADE
jgi:hypothetical protein